MIASSTPAMRAGAGVVQVGVLVIWLGMVLAISFLETPLKFRAAGITAPLVADRDDITGLVAEFDQRAFADEVLGPIFLDVARVDLSAQ